jgi:HEPN domain-containing protein
MSESPETIRSVRQWVEKAEHDLIAAEHTLTLEENCPLDTICFHTQQCAEKYIKAFLVQESIGFPKTHDLRALMQLIPLDLSLLGLDKAEVLKLNKKLFLRTFFTRALSTRIQKGLCSTSIGESEQQSSSNLPVVR